MIEMPQWRMDRFRAALLQARLADISTDEDIVGLIWDEVTYLCRVLGLDEVADAEPESHQEEILTAMTMMLTTGIAAGYGYAKLPRRM